MQHQKTSSIISLLVTVLVATAPLHAGNSARSASQQLADIHATQKSSTGEFFGYDQKTRKIWIDDYLYILSADYRVVGTSTKLGLLSAIKYQEKVEFKTAPNPKQPSIPYVIEIRRK